MYYSVALLAFIMMTGIGMDFSTMSSENQIEISEDLTKMKPKEKTVKINGLLGKYTVQVGQKLEYEASIHGSVGFTATANSSDSEALPLIKSHVKYDNKQRAKMSGGDSATKYFLFQAKKIGTYQIHAQHYFRGDLEREHMIEITVEE